MERNENKILDFLSGIPSIVFRGNTYYLAMEAIERIGPFANHTTTLKRYCSSVGIIKSQYVINGKKRKCTFIDLPNVVRLLIASKGDIREMFVDTCSTMLFAEKPYQQYSWFQIYDDLFEYEYFQRNASSCVDYIHFRNLLRSDFKDVGYQMSDIDIHGKPMGFHFDHILESFYFDLMRSSKRDIYTFNVAPESKHVYLLPSKQEDSWVNGFKYHTKNVEQFNKFYDEFIEFGAYDLLIDVMPTALPYLREIRKKKKINETRWRNF